SSRSSQSTSTTAGRSDTSEKLRQDRVELVRPLDVHEMPGPGDLAHVEFVQLRGRDERIRLADDEPHRLAERAHDAGGVAAIANRLDRSDQPVGVAKEQ